MTAAQTFKFSGLKVLIGDGATPTEVFAAPCGLTERSFSLSKELGESQVPDCDDEDAASWTERDVTSKAAEISGQGVLAADALPVWRAFIESDQSKNVHVELHRNGTKIGHWAGKFHLESFQISGSRGERVNVEVSMQSDGACLWVPV